MAYDIEAPSDGCARGAETRERRFSGALAALRPRAGMAENPAAGSSMEIQLLGALRILVNGGEVPVRATKHRRLLAALALHAGEAVSTDALTDAVWGASPPASSRNLLQVYVSQLRKLLPPPAAIHTVPSGYLLEVPSGMLDFGRFEQLRAQGTTALEDGNPALASSLLRRALELWRGPALSEFVYDDFAHASAERLEEERLAALEARIDADLALGRDAELVPELGALRVTYPLRERFVAQLMRALYQLGRQSDALDEYRRLRTLLRRELGLDPGDEVRDLERRILQQDPTLNETAAVRPETRPLPAPPNALLGRQRDLRVLHDLLVADRVRFVVLSGAGGSGKTRLALEAARQAAPAFANGAVFVPLAALRDPRLVVPSIAQALEIPEESGKEAVTAVAEALRSHELLLVVDNAEHVREDCAALVELLVSAPRLSILVTSRTVLHLSGEYVYPVEPLDEKSALALLVERARNAGATVDVGSSGPALRRICNRLDGLPLAIEFAASRLRALSPDELLARLQERLPLLTGGPHDAPARQQTLRATLGWSFDLLDANEQRAFSKLSVFAGGFTLEAAEAVTGAIVDELASLVDHSLVQRTTARDSSRFSVLETAREFGAEQLHGDERTLVEQRHAEFFLSLAEGADLRGPGIRDSLARLGAERDNLRVALMWFRQHDVERELQLATTLARFCWLRGELREGRRSLESALAHQTGGPEWRAEALAEAAGLAWTQLDYEAAAAFAYQGLAIAEQTDDALNALRAHTILGNVAGEQHRFDEARRHFEQSIALAREAHLDRGLVIARLNLASLELDAGELKTAEVTFERLLAGNWGEVPADIVSTALLNLGLIAHYLGRSGDARRHFSSGLDLAEELGIPPNVARALQGLAAVEAASGGFSEAARLLGVASGLLPESGAAPLSLDLVAQTEAAARSRLGDVDYAAAHEAGRVTALTEGAKENAARGATRSVEASAS